MTFWDNLKSLLFGMAFLAAAIVGSMMLMYLNERLWFRLRQWDVKRNDKRNMKNAEDCRNDFD